MEGNWNPIKASRGNIGISHLFFADGTKENSETVKEVLEWFCTESGQKISTCKSRVYFSQNVDDDMKGRICDNLNIQATNNLGKYLGFPLRVCLFWVKITSGNAFPEMQVFGWSGK